MKSQFFLLNNNKEEEGIHFFFLLHLKDVPPRCPLELSQIIQTKPPLRASLFVFFTDGRRENLLKNNKISTYQISKNNMSSNSS